MRKKKAAKKPRGKKKTAKRSRSRHETFKIGGKLFRIHPVLLRDGMDLPKTSHCHAGDLVCFSNKSSARTVVVYFPNSPFLVSHGPQTLAVVTTVHRQIASGLGQYDSEKSFQNATGTGGPPNGPSVVVE